MIINSVRLITDSISEDVVAGVKQATQSNESDAISKITQSGKRKAESTASGLLSRTVATTHLELTEMMAEIYGHG